MDVTNERRWDLPGVFDVSSRDASQTSQPVGPGDEFVTVHSGLPLRLIPGGAIVQQSSAARQASLGVKRVADIVLALAALLVLSPLLVAVALAIRFTSPGPVLFCQSRVGKANRLFPMVKFRTMYVEHSDQSGVAQTRAGDIRVTRIGRVLRKTSIDELPQLLNVLAGNMSLVGPRPHVPEMLAADMPYHELVPYYDLRHDMTPGITGWAQANGFRGPTEDAMRAKARVDHDLAYIQNFSLWLDVRTIALTLKHEFLRGSGV